MKTVGVSNTPQIIYSTSKGRCSTFLSKSQFLNCLLCFLQIKQRNIGKIKSYNFQNSGININTENGKYLIVYTEIKAFLERYNRAALEKLEVELTAISAAVRNSVKGTVAEVNNVGCSCADMIYRRTICKHQIATQLHLQSNGWGSLTEYLQQNVGKKWEDKLLAMAKVAKSDLGL
ncbi:MAG: hypothetical protein F6K25_31905 [Okeania sp. SIO2G4]|uniref:hypothetical protein n=1 Tax=unclassified Okeania TaxID=2634635 RepID=UPI0013BBD832|nr:MULTISPECIES: hypothetical protein [unclassified Okeania]NEP04657.1 hypothetical protein [Okeania sp. SIO4D6]NEP43696.1 hypothetical protein [Okeania sp. SIO2H7]NEP76076.1 hypothetical protein [Okeania sp. SIO2G5]NEP97254.1 hypothetical protein [Okeania sp. SIO2F5]NEQ94976.1 hypothetical protein [Okeania sp. SIO2G4]